MQYKYNFLHKVYCHRILYTRLLSDAFCSNFKKYEVQNKGKGDTIMSQRLSLLEEGLSL